jgi:hypothetical protein
MNMKIANALFVLAFAMVFTACEKEADITLPNAPQRLVVEGRIQLIKGSASIEQSITLSVLGNYFDQLRTPRVTDAIVTVTDEDGTIHNYTQSVSEPGKYINNTLTPALDETYVLQIVWQGDTYEATETLVPVSPIDAIYQKFEEENQFEDAGIKVAIDFTDPASEANFYFWELLQNGKNAIVTDPGNAFNLVSSDKFFNGQQIVGLFPSEEKVFDPGDEATVRHIGLSKNEFDFLFQLLEQTSQTGQLFDIPAAGVAGNIRNLTNSKKNALGYFGASEIDERTLVIEPN